MRTLFIVWAWAATASAQFFPIAGVVTDANSGSAMKRVHVVLAPENGRTLALVTGEDGRFRFDVPKGKYRLTAEYRAMRQTFGMRGPGIGFGVAIFTGPDQDTSNLVFRWFPPGAISGKIIDDRGEAAQGVLVQLIREFVNIGRKTFRSAGYAYTNDLGEYRFSLLAGGTFYLVVTGEPWYTQRTQRAPAVLDGVPQLQPEVPNEPAPAYAPAYYANALDINGASPLVLAAGAEVKADFTLRTLNGVNVHVRAPGIKPGSSTARLSLLADGIEGVQGFQRQTYLIGEAQTIFGVPPGRYTVQVIGAGPNALVARKTIDVGASDVNVELQLQPPPSITGKIMFAGARPRGSLYARLVSDKTGSTYSQPVNATGSFSYTNAPVGKYRPILVGNDGLFISQIGAEGAPLEDGLLEITDGASIQLNIVASNDVGRVKGFVKNGGGPVAGVLVVLSPKQESKNPYDYRGYQTDSDGSFDYQNIPAGDYILFAVDRFDLEYTNPEVVRPYLSLATSVHVTAHAVANEQISVVALPGQ